MEFFVWWDIACAQSSKIWVDPKRPFEWTTNFGFSLETSDPFLDTSRNTGEIPAWIHAFPTKIPA